MSRLVSGVHPKGTITLADVIQTTQHSKDYPRTGAVAVFIGTVRNHADHKKVTKLELQAYEEPANKTLRAICRTLKRREGITDVQIHHFLGEFSPGEDLVYVLVAGTHRHLVFPVLQEAVDRYKTEAPIFKKEYTCDRRGMTRGVWISEKRTTRGARG